MIYTLPETVELGGTEYRIRWDYRPVLDICAALSDPELSDQERAYVALNIFYPELNKIPQGLYQEAIERCLWFINCGDDQRENTKSPRLVDWEQDFNLMVNPINRVLGLEIRKENPLHWFTFLSAYMEIGDCTFAQVVRIRDQKARGKSLDKQDLEWYRRNRNLVDLKTKYTSSEESLLKELSGGTGRN